MWRSNIKKLSLLNMVFSGGQHFFLFILADLYHCFIAKLIASLARVFQLLCLHIVPYMRGCGFRVQVLHHAILPPGQYGPICISRG